MAVDLASLKDFMAVVANCSVVAKSLVKVPRSAVLAELTSKKQLATSTVPAECKVVFPATLAVHSIHRQLLTLNQWQLLTLNQWQLLMLNQWQLLMLNPRAFWVPLPWLNQSSVQLKHLIN